MPNYVLTITDTESGETIECPVVVPLEPAVATALYDPQALIAHAAAHADETPEPEPTPEPDPEPSEDPEQKDAGE